LIGKNESNAVGLAEVIPWAAVHFVSKSRCGDSTKQNVDPRRRVFFARLWDQWNRWVL
jgi:hypothetical protein